MLLAAIRIPSLDLWVGQGYYRKVPIELMLLPRHVKEQIKRHWASLKGAWQSEPYFDVTDLMDIGEV